MPGPTEDFDFDHDGKLTKAELIRAEKLKELGRISKRFDSQRRMTWIAVLSMVVFTFFLFSPLIGDERVNALSPIIQMFYIAQGGIIAAFFGSTTWANKSIHAKDSEEYDDGEETG